MKQITLDYTQPIADEGPCLLGMAMRWALFGLMLWWLWPSGSHAFSGHIFAWVIAITMAFWMLRQDLQL